LPSVEYIQARRLVSVVLPTPPLPVIASFIPYCQVLNKTGLPVDYPNLGIIILVANLCGVYLMLGTKSRYVFLLIQFPT
jgi:hypothetical protein